MEVLDAVFEEIRIEIMLSPGTPPGEVEIDAVLVCALLQEQHPDLAELPLRLVDAGWDNIMWRLGDALAVRLPRRTTAATLIEHEQRWLPEVAPLLPLPVPVPVRIGLPGAGYPWPWSVAPWFEGVASDLAPPDADQGEALGAFLRRLHVAAPSEAPRNPARSVPLRERQTVMEERLSRLIQRTDYITSQIRSLWEAALDAPLDLAPTWLHGDLHSRNALVENGKFSAIIDWGDMAQGDPATDLAALWNLLPDPSARATALQAYGPISEATRARALGWTILFGVMLLDSGLVNDPRLAEAGKATLQRVTAAF